MMMGLEDGSPFWKIFFFFSFIHYWVFTSFPFFPFSLVLSIWGMNNRTRGLFSIGLPQGASRLSLSSSSRQTPLTSMPRMRSATPLPPPSLFEWTSLSLVPRSPCCHSLSFACHDSDRFFAGGVDDLSYFLCLTLSSSIPYASHASCQYIFIII